jgi:hypothetical protein
MNFQDGFDKLMNFKEINVYNIGYGHPRKTSHISNKISYNVPVNYKGTSPIIFETCNLLAPYGIDKNETETKCTLKCEILDGDFKKFLDEIDNTNLNVPFDRNWFDEEEEEHIFYHRPSFNKNEKHYIRVKIPVRHNKFQFKVYKHTTNENTLRGEDIEESSALHITPTSILRLVVEWKYLWIVEKTFGYYLTVKEIHIYN